MKKTYIPAFTGIRALFAYGIFFYHVNFFSNQSHPNFFRFVDQFYSFIPFFFVISGFVIFYTYYNETRFSKNELFNYFVSRIARIFPILIILNTAVFFLAYLNNLYTLSETFKLYFLNITLLKGFSSVYLLTGIGPSWTNTVEEVFYLLAPLLFLLISRKKILLKFIILSYFIGFILTLIFLNNSYQGILSSYLFTTYFTFFGRVFEFATGIYLAMLYMGRYSNKYLEKYGTYTMYTGLSLLLTAFTLQFLISIHNKVSHAVEIWQGVIVNNFLFPIAIFLILYHLLYYQSVFKKILSSTIMVKLGNATYSFYLLHTTFVLSYIYKCISTNIFVAFIVMVIVSYIFHKAVEQPLALLLKHKFSRNK